MEEKKCNCKIPMDCCICKMYGDCFCGAEDNCQALQEEK